MVVVYTLSATTVDEFVEIRTKSNEGEDYGTYLTLEEAKNLAAQMAAAIWKLENE
jgi:hypothetical protein